MEIVRPLSLWLGAAVCGSFACTLIINPILGGDWSATSLGWIVALSVYTLFFTVPGSGLLCLSYGWSENRGLVELARQGLVVLLGAAVGAAMMVPLGGTQNVLTGLFYGTGTALAWVGLYAILYGRGQRL